MAKAFWWGVLCGLVLGAIAVLIGIWIALA